MVGKEFVLILQKSFIKKADAFTSVRSFFYNVSIVRNTLQPASLRGE